MLYSVHFRYRITPNFKMCSFIHCQKIAVVLRRIHRLSRKQFIINVYADRLKELRIFNLNKDMVKNIMDNVKKKKVTRCSPFPETRTKGIYSLEKEQEQ